MNRFLNVQIPSPYDVQKLLSDCKYGQVLSLFQQSLLLGKLTVGLTLFFHVVSKLLLSSVQKKTKKGVGRHLASEVFLQFVTYTSNLFLEG